MKHPFHIIANHETEEGVKSSQHFLVLAEDAGVALLNAQQAVEDQQKLVGTPEGRPSYHVEQAACITEDIYSLTPIESKP